MMRNIRDEEWQEIISEIWHLKKESISLKQKNREQQQRFKTANEELYLELLEVLDTVDSLVNYVTENPQFSPQLVKRLPKAISRIQQKLLDVLERRQVYTIKLNSEIADFETCRVIDYKIRDDVEENTILKTLRSGFSIEEKILRPVEVIISKRQESG